MNRFFFVVLSFFCIYNTTSSMDLYLNQDIKNTLLSYIVDHPTKICTISPYDSGQKELLCLSYTVSRLNKHYYEYIHSFEHIKKLFESLPYEIRYPLACTMILKKFIYHDHNTGAECLGTIATKYDGKRTVDLPGVERYFFCSYTLCTECGDQSLHLSEVKSLIEEGADPNFYAKKGHITDNIPTPLITLASKKSQENNKKLALLLSNGADVNMQLSMSFCLTRNGVSNWCNISNPTPLAIAIEYENEEAIKTILQHQPKQLYAKQAFLTVKPVIKTLIVNHSSFDQKDLDEAFEGALCTQNKEDIELLLFRGANPHKQLHKTMQRTLNYCLHPEAYQDYDKHKTIPGAFQFIDSQYDFSAIPLPNTDIAQTLCKFGAYDHTTVEQLKQVLETTTQLIAMMKVNKPL